MEKRCEFCMALSPIVYCKADAAHLCLSCDAKVHSANALSYRHPRTLVCELCRYQPVLVRCFDHRMFMCQGCDTGHHVSFQHRTRVVSCYVGCPSAKELAALWGFDLNELESIGEDGPVSFSLTADTGAVDLRDHNRQGNRFLIMQQILDLERLQLSDGIDSSCLVHDRERKGGSPFRHDSIWKGHKAISGDHMDHSDGNLDFQQVGSPLEETTNEHLSLPFSQLDHLTSAGNPLHGDSFWQFRSPAHNNEIWLQNMQDLGVCDEVRCYDDVKIPDVDLTFRNFEELFGTEHENSRPLVDDKTTACSFADKNPLCNKLDRVCASIIEQSNDFDKEINPSDQVHELLQTNNNHPRPIRPSYSASSFSVSRITGESSSSEYKDDGLYPTFPRQLPPHGSYDSENTKLDGKENVIMRHKEKKVLRHEKQAQSTFPRSKSDIKKQGNHQVLKAEGHDHDCANATRSF
ncbi:putative zinc finger protein [Sesamum alatum]|uniref:Zinc finger protein n=1 Tax=Sesamum alatum TaxID=300844 RepID=A0AAE1Y4C2_9LAMI|nr:putative zinc finger protein [Sesamum alatum]